MSQKITESVVEDAVLEWADRLGYDAEAKHATARDDFANRSTAIQLNRRGHGRRRLQIRYRQMVRRFRKRPRGSRHRRVYGQRW
jgi:hypothetical protein